VPIEERGPGVDATTTDPLIGRLLEGRYRVGRRVARGGMATVYEAVDTRLDRVVAVKVMHAWLADDTDFVQRFSREARAAAHIGHPNAVAVFDQGDDDGVLFLAMEYVPGRTLRDVMREEGQIPPARALALLEPVLSALAAAHQAGIVHRDVKPENVLITDDGRVKVADFGLARAVTAATSSTATGGLLLGTVSYLAPELVVDGFADARSDVYASGVLLYEMLTGRKPHEGETPIQVAYKHVHEDVPKPSASALGIPPYLDALVARATSRDRELRPADAKVLLQQVRRVRLAVEQGAFDDPELTEDLSLVAASSELDSVSADFDAWEHTVVVPSTPAPAGPGENDTASIDLPADVSTGGEQGRGSQHERAQQQTPRRRRRGPLVLLLVLMLAAAAGAGGWYVGIGRFTTTPSVLTKPMPVAQRSVEAAGLAFEVDSKAYSETVPAGRVISTDPGPGERILKSGTVSAVVSKGPERYRVPDVEGLDRDVAVKKIAARHLALQRTREVWNETVPEGKVIAVRPAPGSSVKPDTPAVLTVSRGPAPIRIKDWRGEDVSDARSALSRLGFKVEERERYNGSVPEGSLIGQSPHRGIGHRGDVIMLTVSRGPHLVEVPGLFRYGVESAQAELESRGFVVSIEHTTPYFGLGIVVSQSPGGGDMAPKGSTVTIVIA
jgi:eukaryotic-like serine/threonine-protein kinase